MKWMRWTAAALGLFVASGVVAFGVASLTGKAEAQTPPDREALHVSYEQALAAKLNVGVDTLRAAQKEARDEVIAQMVAAGQITPEVAEKLKSAERSGFGGRLFGGDRHRAGRILHNVIEAVAAVIGVDKTDVVTALRDGQSPAQFAESHGIDHSTLVANLTTVLQAKIADALAQGTITQEQADKLSQALSEKIDKAVDHEGGSGGPRSRRGFSRPAPDGTS